jgi:hypothetical protein
MRDGDTDWLARLRNLGPDQVFVQHRPPTPRYGRAQAKLSYLLREAILLGVKHERGTRSRVEIAIWTRPPTGRGFGYYACFRLFFEGTELIAALLFCFYDGTERSPGFKSVDAAIVFASHNGFEVLP